MGRVQETLVHGMGMKKGTGPALTSVGASLAVAPSAPVPLCCTTGSSPARLYLPEPLATAHLGGWTLPSARCLKSRPSFEKSFVPFRKRCAVPRCQTSFPGDTSSFVL